MATTVEPITVQMTFEKATKNTHRYAEVTDREPPKIKTLYVQKWALPDPPPRSITVTISAD